MTCSIVRGVNWLGNTCSNRSNAPAGQKDDLASVSGEGHAGGPGFQELSQNLKLEEIRRLQYSNWLVLQIRKTSESRASQWQDVAWDSSSCSQQLRSHSEAT